MKKVELLAPAGNLEKLKIAIMYGADAVYLGGKKFSLRAASANFDLDDISEGVKFAHERHAKVYVVVNIILHNEDLNGLKEYLLQLQEIGVDGVICADLLVLKYVNECAPLLEAHISTQRSITNSYAIKFYEDLNATRIVLAREVEKENLENIIKNSNIEIEYFIHGAMCVAYSGRCMLSNYYSRRDSNRGGCSQSCRWNYHLWQQKDDKSLEKLNEDVFFTMSSKDLALANNIPELIKMGVTSLKIEGRMKSIYYLATIVRAYRNIIDDYYENQKMDVNPLYIQELSKAANRAVDTGFYTGDMNYLKQLYQSRDEHPTKEFIAYVLDYDKEKKMIKLEQRNNFKVGEEVELFGPDKSLYRFKVSKLYDEDFQPINVAKHAQQIIYLPFEHEIVASSMLRKVI